MMTKIKCLAVDDEPIALEKLKNYIEKVPFLELAGACEDAFEAMRIMNEQTIDAMFTDINMPDLNGLDFVKTLSKRPLVVFTTSYADYAVDSYRVAPVDYLLKPFSFADFQRAAGRLLEQYNLQCTPVAHNGEELKSIYIKVEYKYVRVDLKDIRYIESQGDYLRIFTTTDAKPLMTLSTFKMIKEYLTPNFLQVHRSFIVNMEQLREVSRMRILMDEDTWIPVGDMYKDAFTDYLQLRSIGKRK